MDRLELPTVAGSSMLTACQHHVSSMPRTTYRPASPGLARTSAIDWPEELLNMVRKRAAEEDENLSSLIRKVMAQYVGYKGPTRNIRDRTDVQGT
jgi:hypothetical protein